MISRRIKKVSFTAVTKILTRCKFNPREAGTMRVLADMENQQYYMSRAIEQIHDAQANFEKGPMTSGLIKAIQLLVLAIFNIENE